MLLLNFSVEKKGKNNVVDTYAYCHVSFNFYKIQKLFTDVFFCSLFVLESFQKVCSKNLIT